MHRGDFDHALELVANSYQRSKQRNDRIIRFHLFVMFVLLLIRRKELSAETFEDIALLVDISAAEMPFSEPFNANPLNRGTHHALRALYYLSLGDNAAACASLQESAHFWLERNIERSVLYFELYAVTTKVSFYLKNSDTLISSDRAAANAIFQSAVKKLAKYAKTFTLAQPRASLYQGWQRHAQNPAQAHEFWNRSLLSAQALQMPYDEGLAHATLAGFGGISAAERDRHAQEARRLFGQIGAACDLIQLDESTAKSSSA
jgi:hypothetical protein